MITYHIFMFPKDTYKSICRVHFSLYLVYDLQLIINCIIIGNRNVHTEDRSNRAQSPLGLEV